MYELGILSDLLPEELRMVNIMLNETTANLFYLIIRYLPTIL